MPVKYQSRMGLFTDCLSVLTDEKTVTRDENKNEEAVNKAGRSGFVD